MFLHFLKERLIMQYGFCMESSWLYKKLFIEVEVLLCCWTTFNFTAKIKLKNALNKCLLRLLRCFSSKPICIFNKNLYAFKPT